MAFDRIAVLAAIFLSFNAFRWRFESGNAGIVRTAARRRERCIARRAPGCLWAAVVFGLLASLKLLPLFGAIAFLCLPEMNAVAVPEFCARDRQLPYRPGPERYSVQPMTVADYGAELMGRMPGGSFYEPGGPGGAVLNEDTIDFVLGVHPSASELASRSPVLHLHVLGWASLVLPLWRARARLRSEENCPQVAVVSLVVLTLWLFLFRQKPYGFETFVPFMIAAGYGISRRAALYAVAASILVSGVIESRIVDVPFLSAYYRLTPLRGLGCRLDASAQCDYAFAFGNLQPDERQKKRIGRRRMRSCRSR